MLSTLGAHNAPKASKASKALQAQVKSFLQQLLDNLPDGGDDAWIEHVAGPGAFDLDPVDEYELFPPSDCDDHQKTIEWYDNTQEDLKHICRLRHSRNDLYEKSSLETLQNNVERLKPWKKKQAAIRECITTFADVANTSDALHLKNATVCELIELKRRLVTHYSTSYTKIWPVFAKFIDEYKLNDRREEEDTTNLHTITQDGKMYVLFVEPTAFVDTYSQPLHEAIRKLSEDFLRSIGSQWVRLCDAYQSLGQALAEQRDLHLQRLQEKAEKEAERNALKRRLDEYLAPVVEDEMPQVILPTKMVQKLAKML